MLDETFLPTGANPPANDPDFVQVGAFEPRSFVAGPGVRSVIWVSGCLRRCPGCMKPDLFSFDGGRRMPVERLAEHILSIRELDGVTYSGGEPFEQANSLARLSRLLKPRGLTVCAYSGYRLRALQAEPDRFGVLLDQVDLLIDGEYRQEMPGPLLWRGSANQELHALSAKVRRPEHGDQLWREIQASVSEDRLRLTGFPSRTIEEQLRSRLLERGIVMVSTALKEN